MKIIELNESDLLLDDLLEIARQETVILRKAGNEGFVLAPVDEFALEVELLRNNEEFMAIWMSFSNKKLRFLLKMWRKNWVCKGKTPHTAHFLA
jgi:hypothetical protein